MFFLQKMRIKIIIMNIKSYETYLSKTNLLLDKVFLSDNLIY